MTSIEIWTDHDPDMGISKEDTSHRNVNAYLTNKIEKCYQFKQIDSYNTLNIINLKNKAFLFKKYNYGSVYRYGTIIAILIYTKQFYICIFLTTLLAAILIFDK